MFEAIKTQTTFYKVEVEKKRKKNKKTGKTKEIPIIERFSLPAPYAYRIEWLRTHLRRLLQQIVNGDNFIEFQLHRFPQVNTVLGELKAIHPNIKFTAGWTTNEEENTLFRITRDT